MAKAKVDTKTQQNAFVPGSCLIKQRAGPTNAHCWYLRLNYGQGQVGSLESFQCSELQLLCPLFVKRQFPSRSRLLKRFPNQHKVLGQRKSAPPGQAVNLTVSL